MGNVSIYEEKYEDIQIEFDAYSQNKLFIVERFGKEVYDEIMDEIHDRMTKIFEDWKNEIG